MDAGSIDALREALAHSPDNVPLRRHLAATLLQLGREEEAEAELREALRLDADNDDLKVDLADAYYRQSKTSHALVILEDLTAQGQGPARAHLLLARLLLSKDDHHSAKAQYKLAIEKDDSLADADLADSLDITDGYQESESDVVEGRQREAWGDEAPVDFDAELERPKIDFNDVGGMDDLKEEIRVKVIYPLEHPELYQAYGKAAGGGVLMYGPPGCGKTHLARATAGEIKAGFIAVGISDVLDMWIGNSEKNLHALFDQARRNAPCVLFFDEVDALGGRRSDAASGGARKLVNQFLSEMDGVDASNEGVLILAATNAPWHVDAAFRRPGRFDRVLFVPPPDRAARAEIAKIHCRGKPVADVDFDQIARKTDDFSGADLGAVIDTAIENKLREAIKAGGKPKPLSGKDFLAAAKKLKPTTREWFSTARNYALYSNQGGTYDDVLKYLNL
ncbi:MAG: ATP-binding protein [Pirellulales bacterium]|nr:ATP-binding protein [Pirellulales bacterium]